MSDVIIDTNVAVVANRQNSHVIASCVDACVLFLAKARAEHVVLIDSGDEMRAEYAKALKVSPPFRVGAQFLLHIYQHQFNPRHVRRIELSKTEDGQFVDFPSVPELATFDIADRKFAALARKTAVAVTNAIDSDWAESLPALNANGIAVDFLCGSDTVKWFAAGART